MNRFAVLLAVVATGFGLVFAEVRFSAAKDEAKVESRVRWEYKLTRIAFGGGDGVPNPGDALNKLGADGWEYAGYDKMYGYSIFKRPRTE